MTRTPYTDIRWPRGQVISQEALRQFLVYDANSGVFTWKVGRSGMRSRAGCLAGSINKAYGYLRIKLAGVDYQAHRLAWLYVYGRWPENEIDHINGIRTDNRISNLRDVSGAINQHNRRTAPRNSTLGILGVRPSGKKFSSSLSVGGERKYLGTFDSPELAHQAYVAAKRQFHEGNML